MSNPADPSASNVALDALHAKAAESANLNALRLSGALGRWHACQSATANYHAPHVTICRTFWGAPMEVDIRETVSSEIFIHGVYEPELSAFFHRFLKPGQTFVDVGAHYGYFSLLAADRVGEGGRVVSIEPCERTTWRLYHNVRNAKQVTFHQVAAWEKEEHITLLDYGPLFSAFNSIGDRRIHESAAPVKATPFEVRAVALDDYFSEIGIVPDVIKIDAESAEIQVLRGLQQTMRSRRPIITTEVGDYSHLVEQGVPTSAEVLRAISEFDYVHYSPTLDGLLPHEAREGETYSYGNVVSIPRESPMLPD